MSTLKCRFSLVDIFEHIFELIWGSWYCKIHLIFFLIVDGKMQWLFDEKGRRYLDMFAGIVTVSVGHCHPYVTEAAKEQMDRIQHTTTYAIHLFFWSMFKVSICTPIWENLPRNWLANSLLNRISKVTKSVPFHLHFQLCILPILDPKLMILPCSWLALTLETLMLLVVYHSPRIWQIPALRNCYHGAAGTTLGLTSLHTWRYPVPGDFGIKHAINPGTSQSDVDCWIVCLQTSTVVPSGEAILTPLRNTLLTWRYSKLSCSVWQQIEFVGALQSEQSSCIHCRAYSRCWRLQRTSTWLLARSLQDHSLQGRTLHLWRGSDWIWSYWHKLLGIPELWCHTWHRWLYCFFLLLICELVTMAKGIGNGAPLAAVVTTPEIAKALATRVHFNTYGGNPISMAIGRWISFHFVECFLLHCSAVLDVIDKEKIQQRAHEVGGYLKDKLLELQVQ